jgi:hypothetical protein
MVLLDGDGGDAPGPVIVWGGGTFVPTSYRVFVLATVLRTNDLRQL